MEQPLHRYRSSYDLTQCGILKENLFCSRWYRGLSPGMEWLRLTLDAPVAPQVRVFVADTPQQSIADLHPVLAHTANDLLLYGVRGQYLAFTAEPGAALLGFTLSFPGRSITEGLPFVLQNDDTLRTLLGIYQSGYMDLNDQMRRFPQRLDPAGPNVLPQLPRWLGARRWAMEPAVTKKILPHASLLARLRGTRRGLQLLARLITGRSCQIIEGQTQSSSDASFAVPEVSILLSSQVLAEDARQLRALLPDFIPLGVSYKLIHLKDGAPMDGHSYLDENAVLIQTPVCELDGPEYDEVILE